MYAQKIIVLNDGKRWKQKENLCVTRKKEIRVL